MLIYTNQAIILFMGGVRVITVVVGFVSLECQFGTMTFLRSWYKNTADDSQTNKRSKSPAAGRWPSASHASTLVKLSLLHAIPRTGGKHRGIPKETGLRTVQPMTMPHSTRIALDGPLRVLCRKTPKCDCHSRVPKIPEHPSASRRLHSGTHGMVWQQ